MIMKRMEKFTIKIKLLEKLIILKLIKKKQKKNPLIKNLHLNLQKIKKKDEMDKVTMKDNGVVKEDYKKKL